jgi:hypothetical protein
LGIDAVAAVVLRHDARVDPQWSADVVDAFEHDDGSDSGLVEDIPFEAGWQAFAVAGGVVQQAVAGQAGVEDADGLLGGDQAFSQRSGGVGLGRRRWRS